MLIDQLKSIAGATHILTDDAATKYGSDWTKKYIAQPLAVARPASTQQLSDIVKACAATATPIVPVSGNTGLSGGTYAKGAVMISLERMNKITDLRPDARIARVEAGVILSDLHDAADAHDLIFPLILGSKGSAMIGGLLSTNAGGSNVLRYGSTRGLCLGIEAVLPDGRIMDLMTELHKDNSGYDLKDLLIGAEGTLGFITAAVLKLFPKPRAYATAMVAMPSLDAALRLLNTLQNASNNAVEAFEYMPRSYVEGHIAMFDHAREPFAEPHQINILVELGATAARDGDAVNDGSIPAVTRLEETLGEMMQDGLVLDAVIAQSEAQRAEMWDRRDAAADITLSKLPMVLNDISLPLDKIETFYARFEQRLAEVDPDASHTGVAHLGDGNVHLVVNPIRNEPAHSDALMNMVEDITRQLGGSFSAEHGIGLSKLNSMTRRKDPVAIDVMRAIKSAIDPQGIMNPGKVLPKGL